jgi:type IV secretory pathway TraG/TraD family ATPase VirD4
VTLPGPFFAFVGCCAALAVRVAVPGPCGYWGPIVALAGGAWAAFETLAADQDRGDSAVLRLWGLRWTRDQVCCHFFITGATGTGKTARAVVPIVHGLRATLPDTGILAVDSKGALWQPLAAMARSLGQESTLRLIRVRPTHIPPDKWIPPLRLNLLGDASVPWSTYAKMIVDTATAAGQRGGQSFFKETARDVITHAMQALQLADLPVTLANVHDAICISTETSLLLARLGENPDPAAATERQYFKDFADQPPEQKSGTVYTVANFLRPYTPPDIREVVCSVDPNFTLDEVDAGRLICLSVPQTYQVERRYLNLLFKQLFFLHAFRRFDLDPAEMRRRNVIVLVLDEGQKTTLVSEDGFSDHGTVDELREAGVCLISATQTPLSLYAAFDTQNKADVFMANLRTQVHFRAADEKGAKILSEKMGGREVRKYSGGVSGGRTSRNWQSADEAWHKPAALLSLGDGQAVLKHPGHRGRPKLHTLPFTSFTLANTRGKAGQN